MMQEQMFTQRVKNSHCLSVASLAVFQLNLLVISEWSVWVVLWNFLHKKFPPSAQDKKTILPPQAVPLPLQGRLNVSLTGQHPPKLPLTKRDIQSPFVRQSPLLGKEQIFLPFEGGLKVGAKNFYNIQPQKYISVRYFILRFSVL